MKEEKMKMVLRKLIEKYSVDPQIILSVITLDPSLEELVVLFYRSTSIGAEISKRISEIKTSIESAAEDDEETYLILVLYISLLLKEVD